MPYLLYIENNEVQKEWELTTFPVTIGRHDGCDLVFKDSRVSRRHAEVIEGADGLVITDLQSTHLTLVNSRPIETHNLQHGDHVCLGAKIDLLYLVSPDKALLAQFIDDHTEVNIDDEESAYGMHVTQTLNTAIDSLKKGGSLVDSQVLNNINTEIQRSVEELKCLYEVGQAVNSEQELSIVLQLIIKHVIRATGGERGIIMFYHPDKDELVPVIARDVDNTLTTDERNRFSRSIAKKAMETGQAVVAKDTLQDPFLSSKSVVDFNIRSSICAPLIAKGRTLGTLYVDAKETMKEFSPRDAEFFTALANQSAMAIENARLVTDLRSANRALQHKLRELQALYEVSQSLITVNDLDTVLEKILDQSIDVIGSQRGSILLFDEETEDLSVRVVRGVINPAFNEEPRIKLKRGEGLAGQVVETGEGVISNLGVNDPLFLKKADREADIKGILCVPLKKQNEVIGAINLVNKRDDEAFNEDDLKLLTSLASQAAVTIENFRLYHLAVFDGLTNLHVHRYFQAYLQKEFEKAKRYDTELSLILTDIDHFKSFNDTYGHQIGDLVLIEVARLLKETARTTDLVARYGGEEFCAVLPETNLEGAEAFAERLRVAIEEHKLEVKGQTLSVTISLGVSNFKVCKAKDKDELIKFADTALYQAKHAGRNRFQTYRPPLSSRELAERIAKRKTSGSKASSSTKGE